MPKNPSSEGVISMLAKAGGDVRRSEGKEATQKFSLTDVWSSFPALKSSQSALRRASKRKAAQVTPSGGANLLHRLTFAA